MLASFDHLDAAYGRTPVLRDVSLTINGGEWWAVLGPNGAGKSALAKLLVGALRPSGGSLTICGHDVSVTAPHALAKHVAWVPQNVADDCAFTALELVLMGRTPHLGPWGLPGPHDVEQAKLLLERLGVATLTNRPLNEVSGGERRRVFLARALAQSPQLLVLDEPTAFLDVRHQIEALAVVHRTLAPTLGVVAVLHDVNLAARFATHVMLLRAGRVLALGLVEEVLTPALLSQLYDVEMRFHPSWGPA